MSTSTIESMRDEQHRDLIALVQALAAKSAVPSAPEDQLRGWSDFVELGLTAVSLAEDSGGAGGTFLDEVIVAVEIARHGLDVPFVDNVLASWVLGHAIGPVKTRTRALVTVDAVSDVVTAAWGRTVDEIVVVAADGTVALGSGLDLDTRSEDLAGAPIDVVRIGELVDIGRWHDLPAELCARAGVLRSAEILGAASAVHSMSLRHVAEREQFGKPLLQIPTVAGSSAHIRAGIIQLECAVERAAILLADDRDLAARSGAAAVCRTIADVVATDAAARGHQLHGAMGITQEHALGRFTRKLWAWRDRDGGARSWTQTLGRAARSNGEQSVWEVLST
ncbi:acyl-CoA dehydrogenase family protein [Rhodococcus sp. NPDC057529]|uniref:acyl-CoA dehydrogenase family protein n=1 Tax=Rhodococcus sp. NPDC057529 TaxID=3346158 RepID=UPI00366E5EDE